MENLTKDEELAARREARQRRILENSKNRLERIGGKKLSEENGTNSATTIKEKIIYPDPEIERDVYENHQFSSISKSDMDHQMFELISNLQRTQSSSGQNGNPFIGLQSQQTNGNIFSEFQSSPPKAQVPESKLIKILKSKFHISLLALITYVLIVTDTMFTSNVFLLFLLWEMAEVFLLKTYETSKTSFVTVLFLLSGIPAVHSTIIIKLFETFNKILKDVAIFVFFFVVSHVLWRILVLGEPITTITEYQTIEF